jgi:hypothetical protein
MITKNQIEDLHNLLTMLFKEGELVWFAYGYKYDGIARGYARNIDQAVHYWLHSHPRHFFYGAKVGLNPADPMNPYRNHEHVLECRNILIEVDRGNLSKERQLELILKSGLPITSAVWSGGKSVHFVIALEDALTPAEYKEWHQRICVALSDLLEVDAATCKPANYTRLPLGLRTTILLPDTVPNELAGFFTDKIEDLVVKDKLTWDALMSAVEWQKGIDGRKTPNSDQANSLVDLAADLQRRHIADTSLHSIFTKVEPQELLHLSTRVPNEKLERWLYRTDNLARWAESKERKKKQDRIRPEFIGGKNFDAERYALVSAYFDDLGKSFQTGQHSAPCPSCRDDNGDRGGSNLSVKIDEEIQLVKFFCHRGCDFKDCTASLKEKYAQQLAP